MKPKHFIFEFKLDIIESVGKLRFSLLRRIFVKPTKQWIRCLLLQRRIFTRKERNKRTRIQDCAQFTMQEQFKNRFDRECHLCPSLTVSYVCGWWKMKKYIVGSVIFEKRSIVEPQLYFKSTSAGYIFCLSLQW